MNETKPIVVPFPLEYVDAAEIRKRFAVARGKHEFTLRATVEDSHMDVDKSYPYKGAFKTYPKKENVMYIKSYAVVLEDRITIHPQFDGPVKVVKAPAGTKFVYTPDDICVRRLKDNMDYHPKRAQFFSKTFAGKVRSEMDANKRRRKALDRELAQQKRQAKEKARVDKIFERDLPTTRVTLQDSRHVGNCVAGTLNFLERVYKIPQQDVIDGQHLFTLSGKFLMRAKGDAALKVRKVIRAAWERATLVCI